MNRRQRNRRREGVSLDGLSKAALVKLARSMDIPATSRWGEDTIKQRIREA